MLQVNQTNTEGKIRLATFFYYVPHIPVTLVLYVHEQELHHTYPHNLPVQLVLLISKKGLSSLNATSPALTSVNAVLDALEFKKIIIIEIRLTYIACA